MKSYYGLFRILMTLAMLCSCHFVNSQMIRRLTYSDGLPSSSVMSVLSSDKGFLWLGTVDGLAIYDGHSIIPFNSHYSSQSLSGNLIHSIHETGEAIWIQTNYGLDRLSKRSGSIEEFCDFRENNTFVSDDGRVMMSLDNANKFFYYEEGVSKEFRQLEGFTLSAADLRTFSWRGDTLSVFERHGIRTFVLNRKDQGHYRILKQLPQKNFEIEKCFPDYDGRMWIVDPEGVIWLYDQTTGQRARYADLGKECRSRGTIFSIARHRDSNEVFVGFQWNDVIKLRCFADGSEPEITPLGINSGVVSIEPDSNQEVMWIITDGQGVYEYIDTEVSIRSIKYSDLNHVIKRPVRALWVDDENTLWVGTKGDGILRLKNYNSITLTGIITKEIIDTDNSELLNKEVYSISPSRRNILWIGSGAGLNYYSYKERKIKVLHFDGHKIPRHIHSIYEESESVLWVASSGQGVFRIQLAGAQENPSVVSVKEFSNDNGSWALNFFFAIHPGNDGSIHAVNRGYGAMKIKNNEMSVLPFFNEYASRMVNDIFAIEVQGDTIWYGTGAGVVRKVGNEETLYDREAGLPNATIHAMVMADNNDLWFSTNSGLACLNSDTGGISIYDHFSGVEVNEFSDGAFCRHGNDLYFGGIDGIVIVSLGAKARPSTVDYAPVYFTGIITGGEYRSISSLTNDEGIVIGYDNDSFSIELAAPDHINGAHYTFYYKLNNDKDWSVVENNRVNFSHLPYGSYKLTARYVDAVTGYASPDYSIDIEVETPWYLSWWAKSFYILMILSVIAACVYYVLWRQRREQKRRIKELKQEQKEKMYENKLRFFTGITHEFNAPLTLIYGPCERILNHRDVDSYTRRYVTLIRRNAERLNSLIQEIIDFGRIESGVMPRVVTEVDVSMLCEDILQLFTSLEDQNSIKVERNIESGVIWNTDLRSITKILYNLISNAFKYTPSYGILRLTLQKVDGKMQLRVYNTGKGIEDKDKKRIFDRYTVFENMEENATKGLSSRNGLGMATCKAMVELLEGEINIESKIGEYAEFIVTLPLLELSPVVTKDVIDESIPITQTQNVDMPEIAEPQSPDKMAMNGDVRHSVLLIDDDAEILHLLMDAMSQYTVYTATNANDGLRLVTEKSPDIIITDIMMSGESGIWLAKKVKEDRHTAHIPIVMLSAKSTSMDKIVGLQAGAEAYVAKPFSTSYLLAVVKRLLSSRGELKDYYNSSASAFEYVDGKALNQMDKDFVNKLKEVVEESIGNSDLTADILAEKMNMSTRNFYRKMKALQLPPPIDFIRQHRIKHAARLLATTSIPIQEVLFQSGFNNRSYFYKEFDKVYGMTPRAYRLQEQQNAAGKSAGGKSVKSED